jgi:CubicO group peptidase (beta-lactamase class C family)
MCRNTVLGAAFFVGTLVLSSVIFAGAQPSGPRPEVRALLDALIGSFNSGSAERWEAFTTERFTPELAKRQPAAGRRQMYERLRRELGTIALDRALRRGPDAPIELRVMGSTGESGTFVLELLDGAPARIANLTIDVGRTDTGTDGVPRPPVNGKMSNDEINRMLDEYFSTLAAADVFSGVALVARNGVPVFYKAYGFADRARKIPNTVRTRFNIGSINKTFTQVAIAQLVRDGKLSYSDTLGKFFPEYPQEVSRSATVQQLLDHRAGIADFFGPEFSGAAKDRFRSNADYFRFVGTQPPTFAPGTRNQYCNGCYIALGAIIEQVSGLPYERYVNQHIFTPAEMVDTGYPHSDSIEPEMAIGYTRRTNGADGPLRSNVFMHGAAGSAAGGGYSTAMDLLSYVKAVRAGRFPGAEREMGIAGGAPGTSATVETNGEWTVIVLTNFDPPTGERLGVALGEALRSQD